MTNHQKLYPFCRVTFWKDKTAATIAEEWDICTVSPLGVHKFCEKSFENSTKGIMERDTLLIFLEKAYQCGRFDAKKEIRDVLGVKEPRQ